MNTIKVTALGALVALAAYLAGVHDRADVEARERPGPAVTLVAGAPMSPAPASGSGLILGDAAEASYVCPMHSHITSDHEGKCPICGMDLVPQTIAQAIAGESDTPHQHGMDEHTAASEHQPAGPAIQIDPGVRNNLSMPAQIGRE